MVARLHVNWIWINCKAKRRIWMDWTCWIWKLKLKLKIKIELNKSWNWFNIFEGISWWRNLLNDISLSFHSISIEFNIFHRKQFFKFSFFLVQNRNLFFIKFCTFYTLSSVLHIFIFYHFTIYALIFLLTNFKVYLRRALFWSNFCRCRCAIRTPFIIQPSQIWIYLLLAIKITIGPIKMAIWTTNRCIHWNLSTRWTSHRIAKTCCHQNESNDDEKSVPHFQLCLMFKCSNQTA